MFHTTHYEQCLLCLKDVRMNITLFGDFTFYLYYILFILLFIFLSDLFYILIYDILIVNKEF